jgi:hypothetical protein
LNGSRAIKVVASRDCDARKSPELWLASSWHETSSIDDCKAVSNLSFQVSTTKMNVSGTLSFFRLFRDPSLCLPHHTVSTFNHLPVPLSRAFTKADSQKKVDIRAVVIDKDNCFAVPKENEVYKPYTVRFAIVHCCEGIEYPACLIILVGTLRRTPQSISWKSFVDSIELCWYSIRPHWSRSRSLGKEHWSQSLETQHKGVYIIITHVDLV